MISRGRLQCICRGGSTSRPYHTVSTNHAFVGAVPRPSLQIMHLQGRFPDRPYKSICRGGCSTSRPYKQVFVGAVQSRTAPTLRFPAKRIQIYNSKSRCRTSHVQRSEPRSRCRTPRDQHSEPRSHCRTPRDRDYKHKSIL